MLFNKRGFTLVEVLVAVTLLGLVASLVSAATHLSFDISERGTRKAEAIRTEYIRRNILRGQVQGALPFRYWVGDDKNKMQLVGFDGASDHVRFVSRYGVYDGPDAFPRWVDLRRDNTGNKLVVEEHRILPPDNQLSGEATVEVELGHCNDLQIQYLDMSGEVPQWISSWTGVERKAPLPAAVRIECVSDRETVKSLIPLDYAEAAKQGTWFQ